MRSVDDALGGLARSAAVLFLGTVVGRGLSLLGEVVIVRSLTPSTFGVVAFTYTVVLTATRIGVLGVPNGVSRMLSDESLEDRRLQFLQAGFAIVLASGVVVAIIITSLRGHIGAVLGSETVPRLVLLFLPFVLSYPLGRVAVAALRAEKRSVVAVMSNEIGPRTCAILAFLGMAAVGQPFLGAIVYWVLTPVLVIVLATLLGPRILSVRLVTADRPRAETFRRLLSFSWPLAVRSSLVTLMVTLDVLLIGVFLESTTVGVYRSVQPLRQAAQFVLQSFVFLFLPIATEYHTSGQRKELRRLYRVSSKWIAVLTLPFVVVLTAFSDDVIRVLLGPAYLPAATALSVLAAGLFYNAFVGPNGAMLKAMDRPRLEMYAAGLGVAVNASLNVVLIPRYGILGAAIATVAGYVAFNTAEVAAIYSLADTHPVAADSLKPLAVTTVVGVGTASLFSGTELGVVGLAATGIGLVTVGVLAVPATGSFGEADRRLFERIKHRVQ